MHVCITPPCSVFKTPFLGVDVLVSVCVLLALLPSVCSSLWRRSGLCCEESLKRVKGYPNPDLALAF